MPNPKTIKQIATAVMLLGLAGMVYSSIYLDNDIKYVMSGLVVVSLGSFAHAYAKKQTEKEEE